MANCKVIAVTNQKGGVGKTTTTANLGIGLAQQNKRVLLIDADAQGSLTLSLGYPKPDELPVTLADIMQNVIDDTPFPDGYGILHHGEGVDLLPANIELSGMEIRLINAISRESVLRTYINAVKPHYDYILIDCMPSLGMMPINSLVAADSVIIPSQPSFLSAKGLDLLMQSIAKVKRQINPKLKSTASCSRWWTAAPTRPRRSLHRCVPTTAKRSVCSGRRSPFPSEPQKPAAGARASLPTTRTARSPPHTAR